jgi:hypothetical protein
MTFNRRKLPTAMAAGAVALVVAIGGSAIISSSSSSSSTPNASPVSSTAPTDLGKVIPFQRGNPSPATPVGQIPSSFSAGSGTIITGTAADKAKAAVLAVYPGVNVNRVVQMSDGQYNVHIIGVNWPHHAFVDQSFQVIGAE